MTKNDPLARRVGHREPWAAMTDPQAPTTEAGRALVNEPEWSDKEHRRAIALAIEADARAPLLLLLEHARSALKLAQGLALDAGDLSSDSVFTSVIEAIDKERP